MIETSNTATSTLALGKPAPLFATLMLGPVAQGLAFTAFVSALPQMAADFGTQGEFIAQMMIAMVSLGLMLGALVSGWILEQAGTRLTLITSTLIYGLAGSGGLLLVNPFLLLASRFAVGLATGCMATTCLWGIGAEYQGNRRVRALGIYAAVANASSLASTVLGGYLAELGGWRLAFVQFPAFAAAALLLAWLSLRQVRPGRDGDGETAPPYFVPLLPFYLLSTLLFVVMLMTTSQFPFVLQLDGFASSSVRSLFIGGVVLFGTLTSFAYGALEQLLSAIGAFASGLGCMALALLFAGWRGSLTCTVAAAILMGIYIGITGPYLYQYVTDRTAPRARARALGFLTAFCFLGGFLNPPVLAPLARAIGLRHVFILVALFMAILAAGTFARAGRRRIPLTHDAL